MTEEKWQSPIDGIVCVQLHTKKWPGAVKLDAEDIGIDPDSIPDELIKLGNKRLYPKERRAKFDAISNKAVQFLGRNTLPFVINSVRMTPRLRLPKILETLKEIKEEWESEVYTFMLEYETIKRDWLREYPKFRNILEPCYPTQERLQKKFEFQWVIFEVRGISAKEVDDLALMDSIKEAQKEFNEQADEMVKECITMLRAKVAQTVTNLSNRLKEGKIVRNDTLASVKNIHDMFEEMNVWGDTEVSRTLMKLKVAVDGIGDSAFLKNNKDLTDKLINLADDVAKAAENLEDVSSMSGRFKRFIDVED